jgi:hypothetical protein
MKTENEVVAFKGFDSNMSCRGFKYEIGKSYSHDGKVEKCGSGFHACEFPLDVFNFYPPSSRFAKVSLSGEIDRGNDKIAAAKIRISAEIKLPELVSNAVDFIFNLVDWSNKKESNTGYRSAATNTGDQSAATNTGDQSAATNTGYRSAATNTGDQSAATNTGYQSAATNTGYQSAANVEGEKSVAISSGYQGKAKASKGSAIFLVFRDEEYNIIHAKAAIAGNEIKPDTWYSLDEIGNFVEVE